MAGEAMRILVINGPNLNRLGQREPEIYGHATQKDLFRMIKAHAKKQKVRVVCMQSNDEGKVIQAIHKAQGRFDGIVINPAAWTHYSYAVLDALKSVTVPALEVHISDITKREAFRQHSVTKEACVAQISGKGFNGYLEAMDKLIDLNKAKEQA